MKGRRALFRSPFPLVLAASLALVPGCAKTEYVRVPAICPNDPFCLNGTDPGDVAKGVDADRLAAFTKRNAESTVEVRVTHVADDGSISEASSPGALLGASGLVLTAYLPIRQAQYVSIRSRTIRSDGRSFSPDKEVAAYIIAYSPDKDVAVVVPRADVRLAAAFPIRRGPSIRSDRVLSLGRGTALKQGRVLAVDGRIGGMNGLVETDLPLASEDVGAPAINVCGEVVGVTVWRDAKKGRSYYVPIDAALAALNVAPSDLR